MSFVIFPSNVWSNNPDIIKVFSIIFMLINHYTPPREVYWAFLVMGFLVFMELVKADLSYSKNHDKN